MEPLSVTFGVLGYNEVKVVESVLPSQRNGHQERIRELESFVFPLDMHTLFQMPLYSPYRCIRISPLCSTEQQACFT